MHLETVEVTLLGCACREHWRATGVFPTAGGLSGLLLRLAKAGYRQLASSNTDSSFWRLNEFEREGTGR